jgi:hypothetical protein
VSSSADRAERPATAERITVSLIQKAADDLQRTMERTGWSKTDIVNRALSLYEYLDSRLAAGDDLLVRSRTGQTELIRLL